MTTSYCFVSKLNSCNAICTEQCANNRLYLTDRLNFKFPVVQDSTLGITTIFNSKISSISRNSFNSNSVRIDILDENLEEIKNIVDTVYNNEQLEGSDYTNGNLAKEV
jgi:hypothetical protein